VPNNGSVDLFVFMKWKNMGMEGWNVQQNKGHAVSDGHMCQHHCVLSPP
jgi:hypothetical protein